MLCFALKQHVRLDNILVNIPMCKNVNARKDLNVNYIKCFLVGITTLLIKLPTILVGKSGVNYIVVDPQLCNLLVKSSLRSYQESKDENDSVESVVGLHHRPLQAGPDFGISRPRLVRPVRVLHVGHEEDVDGDEEGGDEGEEE